MLKVETVNKPFIPPIDRPRPKPHKTYLIPENYDNLLQIAELEEQQKRLERQLAGLEAQEETVVTQKEYDKADKSVIQVYPREEDLIQKEQDLINRINACQKAILLIKVKQGEF